jgi:hypothetical protein
MKLFLLTDLKRADFPYLKHNFNEGEPLLLHINHSNVCQGVHGITCTLCNDLEVHEIPMHAIGFVHEGKAYGILLTEQLFGQTIWYSVALPFDRMQLLQLLQTPWASGASFGLQKHKVLKVMIEKQQLAFNNINIHEIQPLF